jgi:hypothetical protein
LLNGIPRLARMFHAGDPVPKQPACPPLVKFSGHNVKHP